MSDGQIQVKCDVINHFTKFKNSYPECCVTILVTVPAANVCEPSIIAGLIFSAFHIRKFDKDLDLKISIISAN